MKHLVGMSGGVDSQAAARKVLSENDPADVILLNSDAGGNEHPLTTEHLHWYSANVHPIVFLTPIIADMDGRAQAEIERRGLNPRDSLTFDLLADLKTCFPMARHQFCTQHLKLQPQLRWIMANIDGVLRDGFDRYVGVRADESDKRSKLSETEWDTVFDCQLHRPILRWSKQQCFDYVHAAGEKTNPLYAMGFDRVGCAPCVNSRKEDIRNWAARFPEMIDKVRRWEKTVGKPFFNSDGKGRKKGEPVLWIDDMVRWAKTERGGKTVSLPYVEADAAAGACVSRYSLCE